MTMIPTQQAFNHIVAFEVSKDTLVVHTLPADEQCTIPNMPQAVRRLLKAELKRNRKERLGAVLIVCEATGGYERHVLDVAIDLGVPAARIAPRKANPRPRRPLAGGDPARLVTTQVSLKAPPNHDSTSPAPSHHPPRTTPYLLRPIQSTRPAMPSPDKSP